MSSTTPPAYSYGMYGNRSWYRCRDLTAAGVVLMIGAAMIHTLLTKGAGNSVTMALQAFALGIVVLIASYGVGAIVDRVGRRFPSLVKPRNSRGLLVFCLLVATAALGYFEYQEVVHQTIATLR